MGNQEGKRPELACGRLCGIGGHGKGPDRQNTSRQRKRAKVFSEAATEGDLNLYIL
jgi:hypothetical protein